MLMSGYVDNIDFWPRDRTCEISCWWTFIFAEALQLSESQQKRPDRLAHVRNAELVKKFEVTEVEQLPESVAASRSNFSL